MVKRSLALLAWLAVGLGFGSSSIEAQGFVTLYSFAGDDGSLPLAGLIEGSDGALYGTTFYGGGKNYGVVFKIEKDGGGFLKLHDFDLFNGAYSVSGLFEGSDGALYGVTSFGGDLIVHGILFKINRDGTGFQILHEFDYINGESARGGVIEGSDGVLYGTTAKGGIDDSGGSVFSINKDGTGFRKLHDFQYANGHKPEGPIIEGSDGFLYGTTLEGGDYNYGIVFRIAKDGSRFSKLHDFDVGDIDNGAYPWAGVIEGSDGKLYGTTAAGGALNAGVVFRLRKDGTEFGAIYSFVGTDGFAPHAPLVESDDLLYGTTEGGGNRYGVGVIFRLGLTGEGYRVVHHFGADDEGTAPWAGLVHGSDGGFYGTTRYGGLDDLGTVFQLSVTCEAAIQVPSQVAAGSVVPIKVHIAHRRPKTVTVPWELRLIDPSGQPVVGHTTAPHTFEPGDVVDRNVEFRLPDDLAAGTYTLELAISGMAGTKGATTTFRVIRAE